MPITKSAKKSLKVSLKRNAQNLKQKLLLSKALKGVKEENLNHVISVIDKSAKVGIIHKNKASRLKAALMKKIKIQEKPVTKEKPAKVTVAKKSANKTKPKATSKVKK